MYSAWVTIYLAFLEGFGLIISPCILPILPLILSASLTGSRRRPFGIVVGFVIIFTLFTLFSRLIIQLFHLNPTHIRWWAYGFLLLFGIIMLSSTLTEKFSLLTARLARVGSNWSAVNNTEGGFVSGFIFGGLTAIIWTPCAGPILAAVIVQTIIQQTTVLSGLTVFSFGLGAGVPMLIIALCGRKIMQHFSYFKKYASLFRKCLGAIVIAVVIYLVWSEGISTAYASEKNISVEDPPLRDGLLNPYLAPSIAGITDWINSMPIDLDKLKGKVVLIDFWTYSCINCLRTLPYLKDWYQKYHAKGLEIIGIHAPEFEFEKDLNNVKNAVVRQGILWPIALDNRYMTWLNFNNHYWPAHYLIDKNGYVVYQHFGEGDYDITENNIQALLGAHAKITQPKTNYFDLFSASLTPETYLGFARAERYAGTPNIVNDKAENYQFPTHLATDDWALQGTWTIQSDRARGDKGSAIRMHFSAGNVYMVMGSSTHQPIHLKILLDGKVMNNALVVKDHKLYTALALPKRTNGMIEVQVADPGLEVYTFTFG